MLVGSEIETARKTCCRRESGGKAGKQQVDWAYAQYFIGRREKVTPAAAAIAAAAANAVGGIKNCVMPTMHRVALAQVGVLQE